MIPIAVKTSSIRKYCLKFVKIIDKKLPFKNNEFDFVITSHVIEHVKDFTFFINEIERITKQGYIELPTRLGDNIVFENDYSYVFIDRNKPIDSLQIHLNSMLKSSDDFRVAAKKKGTHKILNLENIKF